MSSGYNNKIVFINQATGYLMKDLINAFAEKYGSLALIAGSISESGNPLKADVRISKITGYKKRSSMSRLLSWVWATIQVIFLINIKYRGFHLFITSNPPTLAFLPLFCRNSYSVLIYDVYPDGLVASKFLSESSIVNKLWQRQNKKYFAKALNIFTLTEGMADTLSKYVIISKINVIQPWSLFGPHSKIEKWNNKFIIKHNLVDFFLVMYSGNIGLGHNVESIVEVAKNLRDESDIKFIIIGDGWNKLSVEKRISEYGLNNCLVLPFQSPEMFKYSLPAADIGVVSVAKEITKICAPSKTYNLINMGVPLLAITEEPSELANLIQKHNIGASFSFNQVREMAEFILQIKKEKVRLDTFKNNLKNCAGLFTSANAKEYLMKFDFN